MRLTHLLTLLVITLAVRDSVASPDWPAFHGGGPLTGEPSADPGAPPMKARWTYRTDEDDPAPILGSPAIVGDTVYVGDAEGVLHAVDLKTGKARWTYKAEDG